MLTCVVASLEAREGKAEQEFGEGESKLKVGVWGVSEWSKHFL